MLWGIFSSLGTSTLVFVSNKTTDYQEILEVHLKPHIYLFNNIKVTFCKIMHTSMSLNPPKNGLPMKIKDYYYGLRKVLILILLKMYIPTYTYVYINVCIKVENNIRKLANLNTLF